MMLVAPDLVSLRLTLLRCQHRLVVARSKVMTSMGCIRFRPIFSHVCTLVCIYLLLANNLCLFSSLYRQALTPGEEECRGLGRITCR